jgi:hypothetical protein
MRMLDCQALHKTSYAGPVAWIPETHFALHPIRFTYGTTPPRPPSKFPVLPFAKGERSGDFQRGRGKDFAWVTAKLNSIGPRPKNFLTGQAGFRGQPLFTCGSGGPSRHLPWFATSKELKNPFHVDICLGTVVVRSPPLQEGFIGTPYHTRTWERLGTYGRWSTARPLYARRPTEQGNSQSRRR